MTKTTITTITTTYERGDVWSAVQAAADALDFALLWSSPDSSDRPVLVQLRAELDTLLREARRPKFGVPSPP